MNDKIYRRFCDCIKAQRVLIDEPMKSHTTFRIGGPAEYFLQPSTAAKVQELLRICHEEGVPVSIIGNGSNLLVSDKGVSGAVIQIYKNMNEVTVTGKVITAQAGASLSQLASVATKAGLSGLEFAAGIPGTVGGAVVMNAGAYGGEMKDVLTQVIAISRDGQIITLAREELELGYRTSIIKKKQYIVLEATFSLDSGDKVAIQAKIDELKDKRVSKQPLEYASAGSTFKRPEGHFAGKLIMEAGLCGYNVGDAQISEKHCGFVINKGTASAADVLRLMTDVSDKVKQQHGIELEPEVQLLGTFDELTVSIVSFGFKYGEPENSDLAFDVRFLKNPYYNEELRPLTGNDEIVKEYVMSQEPAKEFLEKLSEMMKFLIPNYALAGKNNLIISIGCTGGKHRSVTLANALYKELSHIKDVGIRIEHRDIHKDG